MMGGTWKFCIVLAMAGVLVLAMGPAGAGVLAAGEHPAAEEGSMKAMEHKVDSAEHPAAEHPAAEKGSMKAMEHKADSAEHPAAEHPAAEAASH